MREILQKIELLNPEAKLVAVSKYVTSSEIYELFQRGQVDFGENRVQDLAKKQDELSKFEIKWHMIGRLQSNKINQLISLKPVLWQSCDSFDKARAVNSRLDYKLDTLLQINSSSEESKQGMELCKSLEIYEQICKECDKINLVGVMSIGANSDDLRLVERNFLDTYALFEKARKFGAKICSMGMSGDYEIALKCGSNMVRLGSILFKK